MGDYRHPGLTQREGVAAVMQLATDMNQRGGLVNCLVGDTIVGEQGVTVAKAQLSGMIVTTVWVSRQGIRSW